MLSLGKAAGPGQGSPCLGSPVWEQDTGMGAPQHVPLGFRVGAAAGLAGAGWVWSVWEAVVWPL